ncbi:hypothetical protein IW140_006306 [Coemansia sp. RSA 1813]|nr:hypothetical protein LPJ74_006052 [Coemansia sp. RSA 1843]KAJ2210424.1 hypothetical protein EV179_006254 [Coemansia sp. RSA 487]KAJ2562838.1 hypothetical protein IW140_006306 [Coemansia sp. RSA 1813]
MFAQVHAYAEHATRTRPNMNDVGRALEERNISTSQLNSYFNSESAACTDPAVASAVFQLNQQARALDIGGLPPAHMTINEASVFFDDAAESMLRKLVESRVKTEEERAERELQKEQARKIASQANMASSRPQHGPDTDGSMSIDKRVPGQRRVRINVDSYTDQESDAEEAIGNIGGDEIDDDVEGEEDADFEAPVVNIAHISEASDAMLGDNDSTRESVQPEQQTPEDESNVQGKEVVELPAKQRVYEVERVLLPSSALPPYIPSHCPPFPSPHTYKRTPVFPKREQDFFRNRVHKAEQSRQAEENLQRLISDPHVDQNKILPSESMDVDTEMSQTEVSSSSSRALQPSPADTSRQSKHNARKMIQNIFPPANFRNMHKRTQLTSFMN